MGDNNDNMMFGNGMNMYNNNMMNNRFGNMNMMGRNNNMFNNMNNNSCSLPRMMGSGFTN
jgi:hypothetical protein